MTATSPDRAPGASGPDSRTRRAGAIAALAGALAFGLQPALAAITIDRGVPGDAASFWRIGLVVIALSPLLPRLRAWRREVRTMAVWGGLVAGTGSMLFYRALETVPVPTATLIYYTFPAFAVIAAGLSARRWRRREVIAVCLVLAGAAIAIGPVSVGGDAAALATCFVAPIGWAALIVVLADRVNGMPVALTLLSGYGAGVLLIGPVVFWRHGTAAIPQGFDTWMPLIVLAIVTGGLPAALLSWAAPRAGGSVTGIIGAFELVVAMAGGWLLLDDRVLGRQLLGAALVLVGVGAASWRQSQADANRIADDTAPSVSSQQPRGGPSSTTRPAGSPA